MSQQIGQSPYLRQQRQFPSEDLGELAKQSDQAYIDVAQKVNARTIGLFAVNVASITGEKWFLQGQPNPQQTLRQLYVFSGAGSIPHHINTSGISGFTKIYGTFTDGTNWYPLPFVSETAANNQVSVHVTPTNIVIVSGGGSPPSITSGYVVLEWLSMY